MRSRLISPSDTAWENALADLRHDIYHLPSYVALEAGRLEGRPVAVLAEDDGSTLLLPLILRQLPDDLGVTAVDATSPYGYSGPLITGPARHDIQAAAVLVDSALEVLAEWNVCTAFVRLHPFIEVPLDAFEQSGELVDRGQVVVIDLSASSEDMWKNTRSRVRTQINRLRREGFAARIDESGEYIEAFTELYRDTMLRVGAAEAYLHDKDYFLGLRDALGDRLKLAVVEQNAELACAGMFSECSGIVEYLFGGTAAPFLRTGPSKLLIHHAREWAKARGNRLLNLGGGLGAADDSLLFFKAAFSKERALFRTLELTINADVEAAATRAWKGLHQNTRLESSPAYFPPYRAPNPSLSSASKRTSG